MCPISGGIQFLIVVVTLLMIFQYTFAQLKNYQWQLTYSPLDDPIHMHDDVTAYVNVSSGANSIDDNYFLLIQTTDDHIASAKKEISLKTDSISGFYAGNFTVTGNFLGQTTVSLKVTDGNNNNSTVAEEAIDVTVIREVRVVDTIFTSSVATLVSIIYINFGCALDWNALKQNLKKPIGPLIGLTTQFGLMPTLSYLLGRFLFPDNPEMQLGFFFTGCSPSGGASNIWTVLLDGNMDLSVTMTALCTLAAFGMMPLWIFTLGRVIFERGNLAVPYSQISMYAVALIVPLAIGFLIQRYMKRVAHFLVRILKGFSGLIILFIIAFAIATNLYLFELFSWQIVVAGLGLPWLGYMFGYIVAKLLKRPPPDCLAIAVETGIQNTGISIFLLRFCLPQPQADLTTVAPVSVAIMTPLPLLALFIYKKVRARVALRQKKELYGDIPSLEADRNSLKDEIKPISTISVGVTG